MSETDDYNSIPELLAKSKKIDYKHLAEAFVRDVYEIVENHPDTDDYMQYSLAALFDLAVTAYYMERVPTSKWYYCNEAEEPELVYPFVNACPTCTLRGHFNHVRSGKPRSANIGIATSTILATFLDMKAKQYSGEELEMRTFSDNGIVDACLYGKENMVLFEIKSAPLIAFPLVSETEKITQLNDDNGELDDLISHGIANVTPENQIEIIVNENIRIPVGEIGGFKNGNHYDKIVQWLHIETNLKEFVKSWTITFQGYDDPSRRGRTHWLTNGCGAPRPRPPHWPKRKSDGYETISDGKSSVGIDRTDDVKKGIYQVLKISTHYKEFFPSGKVKIYSALASNIHAVKHFDGYLSELEDLVWTLDGSTRSYVLERDVDKTVIRSDKMYNLFDAMITFTQSSFRSDYLRRIYGNDGR